MVIPIPTLSINWNHTDKKEEPTKSAEAPIQMSYQVDPVLVLLLVTIVLLSATTLVYAARS